MRSRCSEKMSFDGLSHVIRNEVARLKIGISNLEKALTNISKAVINYEVDFMKPEYVIIHHSLTKDSKTVSWQAIRKYHMSYAYNDQIITKDEAEALEAQGKVTKHPWKNIGYHFGIELVNDEYEILLGRFFNETGAHTVEQNMNNLSLGICCVGNFDSIEPPKEQWDKCLFLVRAICSTFGISKDHVKGHRDFAHKSCPGNLWDMEKFKAQL